jgi:diguanylate cyclase (GGDEF)-like protein
MYLLIGLSQMQQLVEDQAKVQAQLAAQGIAANPEIWRYVNERLTDQINQVHHEGTNTTLYTSDGKRLSQIGQDCSTLCVTASAPLKDFGQVVGELKVKANVTLVVLKSTLIAFFGLIIGLLLKGLLTRFVLRPLERIKVGQYELAFYDPLTALPNRRLMMDRLNQATAASARNKRYSSLLFIDLDNFKLLNDSYGHNTGDALLQQVGQRLKMCVREGDTVARMGGDEFVIILEDLDIDAEVAVAQTETAGEKVLATLNQPYELIGRNFRSTPSIGVTIFRDHAQSVDELLKQADIAMYQAKSSGRNTLRFFDSEMQDKVTARALLEDDLRRAIKEEQFVLYFQPQNYYNGQIIGAEVLLRWCHPKHGMIPPLEFIPLAEETGLIMPIGQWVLETACSRLETWKEKPETKHLVIAVNVSAKQFRQENYTDEVRKILLRYAVNPNRLKLEITESLVLEDVEDTILKMNELKAIGVRFSMDDFGTGYSSLSSLKRLPLDQLKIDRSFVRDISIDPDDTIIVQTIIAMASSLGMEIVAEGVETEAQLNYLHNQDCPVFQGYLFSKPLPVGEFESLLTTSAA